MPVETPASARIQSCRIHDGAVELTLADLGINKTYVIERSYELATDNWNVVHTFPARAPTQSWSDPIAKDIGVIFYRIREGR